MLELDDERSVERDDSLLDLKMILGSESQFDCVLPLIPEVSRLTQPDQVLAESKRQ